MIPKIISKSYTNNPEAIQTGSQHDPKSWVGRVRQGKKTHGTFLKDSSVSQCVLAEYLSSHLDLVESSCQSLVKLSKSSQIVKV